MFGYVKAMTLKLVEPTLAYKQAYIDMIEEWRSTGERMVPFVLRFDYTDFNGLLEELDNLKQGFGQKENTVPSSTYWLIDNVEGKAIGAVNIRHYLNEQLLNVGGHIGYGIRPSMRRKGYATELLKQALGIASKMQISKALVTCGKDNIGSAKTIINNGGILDSEAVIDGTKIQRYWIEIKA